MAVLCTYIVIYIVYGKLIVQIYFLEGALWVVRYQGTITTGTVIKAQLIILIYVSQVCVAESNTHKKNKKMDSLGITPYRQAK